MSVQHRSVKESNGVFKGHRMGEIRTELNPADGFYHFYTSMKPEWKLIHKIDSLILGEWLIWVILIGAVAFTFGVDYFLELSKDMDSADDEFVYVPILMLGFLVSSSMVFSFVWLWHLFLKTFFSRYYKWNYGE